MSIFLTAGQVERIKFNLLQAMVNTGSFLQEINAQEKVALSQAPKDKPLLVLNPAQVDEDVNFSGVFAMPSENLLNGVSYLNRIKTPPSEQLKVVVYGLISLAQELHAEEIKDSLAEITLSEETEVIVLENSNYPEVSKVLDEEEMTTTQYTYNYSDYVSPFESLGLVKEQVALAAYSKVLEEKALAEQEPSTVVFLKPQDQDSKVVLVSTGEEEEVHLRQGAVAIKLNYAQALALDYLFTSKVYDSEYYLIVYGRYTDEEGLFNTVELNLVPSKCIKGYSAVDIEVEDFTTFTSGTNFDLSTLGLISKVAEGVDLEPAVDENQTEQNQTEDEVINSSSNDVVQTIEDEVVVQEEDNAEQNTEVSSTLGQNLFEETTTEQY